MSNILSDTEQAVVETMTMRLNEKQALFFLKLNGIIYLIATSTSISTSFPCIFFVHKWAFVLYHLSPEM
jgi:hypothetical protein